MKFSSLAFLFATFILVIGCDSAEQPESPLATPVQPTTTPAQPPQPEVEEPSVGPDGHEMDQGVTPASVE